MDQLTSGGDPPPPSGLLRHDYLDLRAFQNHFQASNIKAGHQSPSVDPERMGWLERVLAVGGGVTGPTQPQLFSTPVAPRLPGSL